MIKTFIAFIFVLIASQFNLTTPANAQSCPDYYRFVDFGLEDNKGTLYRGGTLLRTEGFSAEALLLENLTQCLDVKDVAKDGHGNPIPVVKSINYLPEIIGTELNELRVSRVKNTQELATKNAVNHQSNLKNNNNTSTKGENFVCVTQKTNSHLSCQLVSPYPGNITLVVYCDSQKCNMPVYAINKELMISASWMNSDALLNNPLRAGSEFIAKVQQIFDFLKPLSAEL